MSQRDTPAGGAGTEHQLRYALRYWYECTFPREWNSGERMPQYEMLDAAIAQLVALRKEREMLVGALRDLLPYARRYCDGRSTYAPSEYNGHVRALLAAGVLDGLYWPEGTLWARDGMGASHSGLSDAEYALGKSLAHWHQGIADEEREAVAARARAEAEARYAAVVKAARRVLAYPVPPDPEYTTLRDALVALDGAGGDGR